MVHSIYPSCASPILKSACLFLFTGTGFDYLPVRAGSRSGLLMRSLDKNMRILGRYQTQINNKGTDRYVNPVIAGNYPDAEMLMNGSDFCCRSVFRI